jgi:hypothetical protein
MILSSLSFVDCVSALKVVKELSRLPGSSEVLATTEVSLFGLDVRKLHRSKPSYFLSSPFKACSKLQGEKEDITAYQKLKAKVHLLHRVDLRRSHQSKDWTWFCEF